MSARYLTIAFTRRFYEFCREGEWSGSCFNGFWGYLQFAYNGVITSGRQTSKNSEGIAEAILNIQSGTSFGGIDFNLSWETEGCSGGKLCHWANTRVKGLADAVKKDSVANYDTNSESPTDPVSWSQVPVTIDDTTPVTYLYPNGGDDYYIILNNPAYSLYYSYNPEWFWNGN